MIITLSAYLQHHKIIPLLSAIAYNHLGLRRRRARYGESHAETRRKNLSIASFGRTLYDSHEQDGREVWERGEAPNE